VVARDAASGLDPVRFGPWLVRVTFDRDIGAAEASHCHALIGAVMRHLAADGATLGGLRDVIAAFADAQGYRADISRQAGDAIEVCLTRR
jgi:hypothetical protein